MSQKSEKFEKLLEDFGINPSGLKFIENKKSVRVSNKVDVDIDGTEGVVIFRKGKVWNYTSNIVLSLGHLITKRIIELDKKDVEKLFRDGKIERSLERGYYVTKYKDYIISLVFSTGRELICYMPKEFRKAVLESVNL